MKVKFLADAILRLSDNRLTSTFYGDAENKDIVTFAPLEHAGAGHIAFLAQSKWRDAALASCADVLVVTEADATAMYGKNPTRALVVTQNPYAWFAWALQVMLKLIKGKEGGFISERAYVSEKATVAPSARIDPMAVVEAGAHIGERSHIFPGAYVGENASVGDDTIVYANASIYHDCKIGSRVIIHSGAVIGADGFGFAPFMGEWVKIPQVGAVRIEDDVEIGANTTVDRGALEDTVVGRGTKLDDQIQLGHNVHVGEHTVMAACTGVAGSTHIGSHCMVGGASSINGHIRIPDGVQIGPSTNIRRWQEGAKAMMGVFPAQERVAAERTIVLVQRLSRMREELKALTEKVRELSDSH